MTLYYLLEHMALLYTYASNVGVIISVAPFFTAILMWILKEDREERPKLPFFIGFVVAMAGICLISFAGASLQLNPLGDFFGLAAAVVWAFYSVLSKKIGSYGYNTIQTTRRIFIYGFLFLLPTLPFFEFRLDLIRFANPVYLFNIFFLGLGASALCFVAWNYAVRVLGAVTTSLYIYLNPVVTVVTSVIVLHERITGMAALGILFTLVGLVISEMKFGKKKESWEAI